MSYLTPNVVRLIRMAKKEAIDNWQGRKNKTRQDRQAADQRDRVHDWDRRRSWAQEHKPRRSADWLAYRSLKT